MIHELSLDLKNVEGFKIYNNLMPSGSKIEEYILNVTELNIKLNPVSSSETENEEDRSVDS